MGGGSTRPGRSVRAHDDSDAGQRNRADGCNAVDRECDVNCPIGSVLAVLACAVDGIDDPHAALLQSFAVVFHFLRQQTVVGTLRTDRVYQKLIRGRVAGITQCFLREHAARTHLQQQLAGCFRHRSHPDDDPERALPPLERELAIYNWSDYVAPATIPEFEREFGVRVTYDVFESNEEMLAKLHAGARGYDIVVPAGNFVTPLVALDAPYGLYLDITGAAHLFGGEAAMLAAVTGAIARQGFTVRGAIAGTSLAAHALARYAPGVIVPPGNEAKAVAPLPIAALDCGDKALRALRHAGLKTIGAVAERLSSELSERLGKSFVTRLRILQGAEEQPLQPRRPLPDLMAEQRFAEPRALGQLGELCLVQRLQSVARLVRRLAESPQHLHRERHVGRDYIQ